MQEQKELLKDLIVLIAKGGNNATLFLFNKIRKLSDELKKIEEELEETVSDIKSNLNEIKDVNKGEDGHTPTKEELLQLIEPLIPEPIKGEDGKDGTDGTDGVDAEPIDTTSIALQAQKLALEALEPKIPIIIPLTEELPKMGDVIVDTLESREGEDKLDKSAIKGWEELEKELKEVSTLAKGRIPGGRGVIDIRAGTNITVDSTKPNHPIINATGGVVGPSEAVDSNIAVFDSTTGTLLKDSGVKTSDLVPYEGATTNVDLGSNSITSYGVVSTHNIAIELGKKFIFDNQV